MESNLTVEDIEKGFRDIQDKISNFIVERTHQPFHEDVWNYDKGNGGGVTRVWEGDQLKNMLEKGGVNFSGIQGSSMPPSAATQFNIPTNVPFRATGVSLVLHASNPHIPTIHMNIRYFECGDVWWFGGGIDLTPYYPRIDQVKKFHVMLRDVCKKNGQDYDEMKRVCDEYFVIKHRKEMRGVSGIFFDHLTTGEKHPQSKQDLWKFVCDVGNTFNDLYSPFLTEKADNYEYSAQQREFQLIRRSRYVEYNLVYDRGTKFGLQSEGRIESILMSLPTIATWKYDWKPQLNSREEKIIPFYFQPKNWVDMDTDQHINDLLEVEPNPKRESSNSSDPSLMEQKYRYYIIDERKRKFNEFKLRISNIALAVTTITLIYVFLKK